MNNSKRNSIIILAKNINLDKEYINILSYSENEMVTLCESNDHLVAKQTNYSFLKPNENVINVGISYATCLQANYIAMQNPSYSNKWFFAFIDRVEYNSEASTNIYYTIDEMSTWWSYWTRKQCFVIREHVDNDTVGLHTIPEGLETGEYIINSKDFEVFDDLCFLMNTSERLTGTGDEHIVTSVNGIWMAGNMYCFDNIVSLANALRGVTKMDIIKAVWIVPKFLLNTNNYNTIWDGQVSPIHYTKNVSKQTTLNGYTPKNNKLLCYPYNYLLATNNNGSSSILHYEKFNSSNCEFTIGGCATIGCSIISIPQNYKGNTSNETEMLIAGKFPTCNWSEDPYTNWLTMNGVNIAGVQLNAEQAGYAYAGLTTAIGVASVLAGNAYGVSNVFSGISSALGTMQESYRHSLVPDTFKGNINGGDYLCASGRNGFYFYKMSITEEYARSIDNFFQVYGYKVNSLKTPNFSSRRYWNFVQIGGGEIIGTSNSNISVPESSMSTINSIFRKGTTIWHDHNNIGNYSLDNTIV